MDIVVLVVYLSVILGIGIAAGRGLKSMKISLLPAGLSIRWLFLQRSPLLLSAEVLL